MGTGIGQRYFTAICPSRTQMKAWPTSYTRIQETGRPEVNAPADEEPASCFLYGLALRLCSQGAALALHNLFHDAAIESTAAAAASWPRHRSWRTLLEGKRIAFNASVNASLPTTRHRALWPCTHYLLSQRLYPPDGDSLLIDEESVPWFRPTTTADAAGSRKNP